MSKLLTGLNLNSSSTFNYEGKITTLKVSTEGIDGSTYLYREILPFTPIPRITFVYFHLPHAGAIIIFVNTVTAGILCENLIP